MAIFSLLYLVLVALATCHSQLLKVKYSSAKLPYPTYCHSVHYDGDDSIFIFGSCYEERERQALKYSLIGDTISSIGNLPTNFTYGSVQSDSAGNLFLFGASNNGNLVIKYNVETNSSSIVATLPAKIKSFPTIHSCDLARDPNTVFVLGTWGYLPKTLSFDLKYYNFTQSATKPPPVDLCWASSIICAGGRALVFPYGGYIYGNTNVWEFDFATQLLSPINQSYLPQITRFPSLMYIHNEIFVLTGFWPKQSRPVASQAGLLRFDPKINTTSFVPVGNWPVKGEYFYDHSPQCVFVHKYARIYCFGGAATNSNNNEYFATKDIFHIDMLYYMTTQILPEISKLPLNPVLFSCTTRTNGYYPDPTDVSMYIRCRDGEMDHFGCPSPTLFNPVTKACNIPQYSTYFIIAYCFVGAAAILILIIKWAKFPGSELLGPLDKKPYHRIIPPSQDFKVQPHKC